MENIARVTDDTFGSGVIRGPGAPEITVLKLAELKPIRESLDVDGSISNSIRRQSQGHLMKRPMGVPCSKCEGSKLCVSGEEGDSQQYRETGDETHKKGTLENPLGDIGRGGFNRSLQHPFGDAYDNALANALAETIIGLFKTDVIHHAGPWRSFDDVEYATLEWVSWFNTTRLLEPLGYLPFAEFEAQYDRTVSVSAEPALK